MSIPVANELSDVMDRVKTWSPPLLITLARRILETLEAPAVGASAPGRPEAEPTRGVPVEKVLGMLKTDREPPSEALG
jgi:hypothetical protein